MGLRLGLIGCGSISRTHRQAMKQQTDASFVAFCDIDGSLAEAAAKEDGGNPYQDFEQMLQQEQLDGVVICTPPSARTGPIAAAAKRGLPILCEKPPAANLKTARQTEEVIRRHDAMVSIAFLYRYYPIVNKVRQLIGDRPVAFVRSRYLGDVANNPSIIARRGWFLLKERSGGMIIDQSIHVLDVERFLFGNVVEVVAQGGFRARSRSSNNTSEDTATLQFATTKGVFVSHAHCWGHNRWSFEMEIVGSDFSFVLDFIAQRMTGLMDGLEVTYSKSVNGFEAEQRAWLDAVRNNDRGLIRSTHADASASLALALAANRSVETGQRELVETL